MKVLRYLILTLLCAYGASLLASLLYSFVYDSYELSFNCLYTLSLPLSLLTDAIFDTGRWDDMPHEVWYINLATCLLYIAFLWGLHSYIHQWTNRSRNP
jgi:hypothetical protein